MCHGVCILRPVRTEVKGGAHGIHPDGLTPRNSKLGVTCNLRRAKLRCAKMVESNYMADDLYLYVGRNVCAPVLVKL